MGRWGWEERGSVQRRGDLPRIHSWPSIKWGFPPAPTTAWDQPTLCLHLPGPLTHPGERQDKEQDEFFVHSFLYQRTTEPERQLHFPHLSGRWAGDLRRGRTCLKSSSQWMIGGVQDPCSWLRPRTFLFTLSPSLQRLHPFAKVMPVLTSYHGDRCQVTQWYRICLPMQETWVQSLGWKDPPEKEMATHSSILAWEIPWTEEPGGLQSTGSQESVTT